MMMITRGLFHSRTLTFKEMSKGGLVAYSQKRRMSLDRRSSPSLAMYLFIHSN